MKNVAIQVQVHIFWVRM